MAEKQNTPKIRFEGFTDPWEQRKLSEVATFGGGHTPPMADPDNYEDGYVLWVTSQDVKSNYLDRTTTQITEKGAKELTLYPAGSLVMVTRSGILRHTLPVAELRKPSTVNQDIRVILPQGECCGEWLLQFFISHNKELLLEFGKTGTTVESVDFGKIKDMLLHMPSTVEQQQIGNHFAKLDRLITLHQRKYDKLCTVKKSMLDKMFPKLGETEPEIRFEGFTDPWEQRKLGELYSLVSEKNDLTFGRESIISVANMYFNANVNVTDEQYLRTYNVMRLGDIAFEGHSNKEFSHGRFVENYIGDGIVSHIFTVLRPHVPFDVNYWRYAINNEKLMRLPLIRSTKASTMMHDLVPSDFLREAIPTPTLAEQMRIGAFLAGLDNLITLHQRKLELLRNIKKSLLDRMFV